MTALCSNFRITNFEIGLQMYISNTPPKAQAIAMKRSGGVIFLSCMRSSLSVLAQRTDQTSNELQHSVSAPGITNFEIGLQMFVSKTPPKSQAIAMERSEGVIIFALSLIREPSCCVRTKIDLKVQFKDSFQVTACSGLEQKNTI